ncbi:uncharacterized protein LOC116919261 isoform X2 [Daphnia magna]|uniref:uncharacterized protein LOC116919261 isoform X2 n=1 Tax=Daphnia magna TaxID=35525 RepID=UPI001E1BA81A|nr:uncharacterized protein LOC116919261 isoform X2 [Daphnia magna]
MTQSYLLCDLSTFLQKKKYLFLSLSLLKLTLTRTHTYTHAHTQTKQEKQMLWKAALTRRISRMIFKCRLSLTSPARTTPTTTRISIGKGNGKRSALGASGAASVVRADNVYLLAVFFVFFLLVMIVAQVMVMRSELSASVAGEWLKRLPQEQSRDAWVNQLWFCFQGRSVCPWQPVAGREKCFVYSAYLDDTASNNPGTGTVRVIGVAKTKKPDRLWCQLGWATNSTANWIAVPAQIKAIREHWNLRYSAVFILCPLSSKNWPASHPRSHPEFVSISTSEHPTMPDHDLPIRTTSTMSEFNATHGHWADSPTGNLLPIIRYSDDPEIRNNPKHQLSVCVKPLHYSFNRVDQLIEFIEIHRLLGVSHFTFYNHTVGDNCDCVLRRYIEQGLVEVLPWSQLDVISQKEIRTEGIFASLNDCLYRHMFDSQYLLMIDLDELIVPRTKFTLTELIASTLLANNTVAGGIHSSANSHNGYQIGAYYFRNAFFYLSWPDDPGVHSAWSATASSRHLDLISLRKTRRNFKLHPHRIRSKYICRPRAVVEVGNHFVWEFRAGNVAAHVPDSLALMHHYRTCEFGGDTCLANPSIQDRSAWKYGDALVNAVRRRFEQFGQYCPTLLPFTANQQPLRTSMATIATTIANATTTTSTLSPFSS